VSTLLPHTYLAVGIIHTEVFHPAVSTLVIYTCPVGNVILVGVTRTLESDVGTTEVQTALILRLPHHIPPPVALRPAGAAAAAAGRVIAIMAITAGGDEQNEGNTIITAFDGTTLWMIG
jgi:hypothetical protein